MKRRRGVEADLQYIRMLGDRHMQVAKLHLAKRMTAMYDELGLKRRNIA